MIENQSLTSSCWSPSNLLCTPNKSDPKKLNSLFSSWMVSVNTCCFDWMAPCWRKVSGIAMEKASTCPCQLLVDPLWNSWGSCLVKYWLASTWSMLEATSWWLKHHCCHRCCSFWAPNHTLVLLAHHLVPERALWWYYCPYSYWCNLRTGLLASLGICGTLHVGPLPAIELGIPGLGSIKSLSLMWPGSRSVLSFSRLPQTYAKVRCLVQVHVPVKYITVT